MVKKDLKRIGIPYGTPDGIADFHAAGRHKRSFRRTTRDIEDSDFGLRAIRCAPGNPHRERFQPLHHLVEANARPGLGLLPSLEARFLMNQQEDSIPSVRSPQIPPA
jgi:hypothetical protein